MNAKQEWSAELLLGLIIPFFRNRRLVVQSTSGWKLVYSGDTRPCPKLVQVRMPVVVRSRVEAVPWNNAESTQLLHHTSAQSGEQRPPRSARVRPLTNTGGVCVAGGRAVCERRRRGTRRC
jgi:hypothetical protein